LIAGDTLELVLLALLGVIKRRLLSILAGSISHGVHVDHMIAVLFRSQCVLKQGAVLLDLAALSVGEEIWDVPVKGAVWADGRAEARQ
jgi:hypothetical protein